MKKQLVILSAMVLLFFCGFTLAQGFGLKKKRPKPPEFADVVIDNYSCKGHLRAPVVFKHWLHRAKYSFRLCHVDIGFAMNAGDTNITDECSQRGLFFGACHNG